MSPDLLIQCTIKLILHSANAGDMAITDVLKQKCSCQAEFTRHRPSQLLSFQSTLDSKSTISENSLDGFPVFSISCLSPEFLLHILNFRQIWQHRNYEDSMGWGVGAESVGKGKELTFMGMHTTVGHLDLKHPQTPQNWCYRCYPAIQ